MLNNKENTVVYSQYAHARICSIIRKYGKKNIEELKRNGSLVLDHEDERTLAFHLLEFTEVFVESYSNVLPKVLCEYLYNLASVSLNGDLILHNLASMQRKTKLKDPNQ